MQEPIFIGELKDQSAFSSKRDAVGHDENRLFANRAGLGRAVDAKIELSQLKGRTPMILIQRFMPRPTAGSARFVLPGAANA